MRQIKSSNQQQVGSKISVSHNPGGVKWGLIIAVSLVWSLGVLVFGASASYILFVIKWDFGWLYFGGVLMLGGVTGWILLHTLKRYAFHPVAEFQNNPNIPTPLVKIDSPPIKNQKSDESGNALMINGQKTGTAVNALTSDAIEEIQQKLHLPTPNIFKGLILHKKINLLNADQTAAKMFGYSESEMAGMTILDLATPESHSIMLRNTLAKFEGTYEIIALKKNGTTFPIEVFSKVIEYRGQMLSAMTLREITERDQTEVLETLHKSKQDLQSEILKSTTELRFANERLQLELKAREQAEQARRESEKRYRQLVEFSPDGILVHSEGKILFANAASAKILGATDPGQLIDKPIMDFVHPAYQTIFSQRVRHVSDDITETVAIELKYIRLDGKTIEVEAVGIPFIHRSKQAIQVVFRDITERKRSEAEITQRNRELTVLQSAGAAITSRLDLRYVLDTVAQEMTRLLEVESCTISEWNRQEQAILQIAKYSPEGWWDPNTKAQVYRLADYPVTRTVLEEQIPEQMTINQPNLDPSELAYMKQANVKTILMLPMIFQRRVLGLIELEDNRVERTFTYHEISMAKLLANQAGSAIENARLFDDLQQHATELTTLNEISKAMVSTLNVEELLSMVTIYVMQLLHVAATSVAFYDEKSHNLWFVAASGEGADQIRGQRLPVGQGIVSWVVENGQMALISDTSKDPRFSGYFDQKSGFATRSILSIPLQTKGRTIGALTTVNKLEGTFGDEDVRLLSSIAAPAATAIENAQLFEQAQQEIEDRMRAEAALEEERALLADRVKERTAELSRANAELARASRLKDEFLAGMSHELRTPLNAILGSAEILQTEVFGELNEKQQRYARNVEESGRHLLALINDILDLSKIEAGKLEMEFGPVSVQSVCEASLRLVKQLAHKKQISVSSDYKQTITTLQADERRLKQILVNLLSNAIKFTPENGQVGLEVTENSETQAVHFTVWDTGIGISKEDMSRLFQPFVQLDSSLARKQAGTGLGLSLVSRMAEMHGGGVLVESEVGEGSRFTVLLPYSGPISLVERVDLDPKIESTQSVIIKRNRSADEHPVILLADDNEDNIDMILEFLEVQGYQVNIARNGKEAIEQARDEKPDVILMDIQMPELDGLEATRRLKADVDLANVPVIALTALAMPGDRERCLAAGASEYLSKPVSPTGLVSTIERFLK